MPVIQAFAEHKDIEECYLCEPPKWIKSTNPEFDNDNYKFRIKHEPRRFWVTLTPLGGFYIYSDKSLADELKEENEGSKVIEVVEVMRE